MTKVSQSKLEKSHITCYEAWNPTGFSHFYLLAQSAKLDVPQMYHRCITYVLAAAWLKPTSQVMESGFPANGGLYTEHWKVSCSHCKTSINYFSINHCKSKSCNSGTSLIQKLLFEPRSPLIRQLWTHQSSTITTKHSSTITTHQSSTITTLSIHQPSQFSHEIPTFIGLPLLPRSWARAFGTTPGPWAGEAIPGLAPRANERSIGCH